MSQDTKSVHNSTRTFNLPFGAALRVGFNYWHHTYWSGSDRLVLQPFVIFDMPRRKPRNILEAIWRASQPIEPLSFQFELAETDMP